MSLDAWSNHALAIIASELGMPVESLRIEALRSGAPAVFYGLPDGTTRSACAIGSVYWQEACAAAAAAAVIGLAASRARGHG